MMSKTIQAFKNEIQNAPKIRRKAIENISNFETPKIVTNLFSLEYDFENEKVSIYYYVEDNEFPVEILSFHDFITLIQ